MKARAFLLLAALGPAGCRTTSESAPGGYSGIEKLSIIAKGME